ncbi:hypothetical protein, partial [Pseudomonas helleri]|uniref:hypothetical protein n=1 Tax=Pseudomonas helleri TaxID=1608996 RepID=UPI001E653BC2
GSRKKSGAQHRTSGFGLECGLHGALTPGPHALAACSLQLAACSLQLAACSLQLAACSQNSRHKKTTAQVVFLYPGVQSP